MQKRRQETQTDAARELVRERLAIQRLDEKNGMNHRQAERLFRDFQRECVYAEVVTGWAGKVG